MLKPLSDKELNIIRGKLMMDHPSKHDVWKVFDYLDWLEDELNKLDYEDALGTEGWRKFFNHPDAE